MNHKSREDKIPSSPPLHPHPPIFNFTAYMLTMLLQPPVKTPAGYLEIQFILNFSLEEHLFFQDVHQQLVELASTRSPRKAGDLVLPFLHEKSHCH